MSFSVGLLGLMPSTIRVSTRTGHNSYGEPSFASSTALYRARILQSNQFIRGMDGESVAVTHTIWARSTSASSITVDDRITLPSSVAQGVTPRVLSVERYPDEDGVHHTKILMGY